MRRLKILFYNWTDFDDPEGRGGGVSVYQKNLVNAATNLGDEVWFLSSGSSYNLLSKRPHVYESGGRGPVRKFEIVNSPLMSPGQTSFGLEATAEPRMEALFGQFLHKYGPFDVVHFNNLEGIPVSFLRLAREHSPAARVVFSLHNYFAVCPQVNLWFQEKSSCDDFREGRKCVNCLIAPPAANEIKWRYRVEHLLRRLGVRPQSGPGRLVCGACVGTLKVAYRSAKAGLRALTASASPYATERVPVGKPQLLLDANTAAGFARRRRAFVAALNTHAHHVLAVSARVAELAVAHGIKPAKVRTEYIGTKFARQPAGAARREGGDPHEARRGPGKGVLRVLYPGYMRRDKGFYFFVDALERMAPALAARLQLVFATKIGDAFSYSRIRRMAHRFDAVTFHNGYTHTQLPQILAGVDLGVVPVLWEDNLPQVAIECVAAGVPILTSDRGGARELLDCPDLVFRAGSIRDFYGRLQAILDDPDLLSNAFARRRPLLTPEEHYARLRAQVYRGPDLAADGGPGRGDRALTELASLCDTAP
jgi:glycosyltransferase involved in cell wall biosynthesis